MFTPQEVSEKTFPKASGFNNGYGMAAVDEFLDALTEDYTALYKDNAALKAKLKVLAEKVEEYRATEDAMRSTLLSAQRMAAQMVSDAQAQRDKMLSDAREEANRQVAQLEQQVAQAQHKLTMAQASLSDFLRRSADLCAQQVSFLHSLPEAEVEEGQPVTLPAPEEGRVPWQTLRRSPPHRWRRLPQRKPRLRQKNPPRRRPRRRSPPRRSPPSRRDSQSGRPEVRAQL